LLPFIDAIWRLALSVVLLWCFFFSLEKSVQLSAYFNDFCEADLVSALMSAYVPA